MLVQIVTVGLPLPRPVPKYNVLPCIVAMVQMLLSKQHYAGERQSVNMIGISGALQCVHISSLDELHT